MLLKMLDTNQPPSTEDDKVPYKIDIKKRDFARGHQRPRCLVIDDNKAVLEFVGRMMTRLGYQVDTAETKPEVITRLTTIAYDLIVTDLEMPDMSGFHLAVTIKTESRTTKVVIMTGRGKGDCLEMIETGWADGWIFKPFGLSDLRDMMKEFGCFEN